MGPTLNDVGIVVEDLDVVAVFCEAIGLEQEGRAVVEGEWAGRVTGLRDQRVEVVTMRTPDGHGRLEHSRFLVPRRSSARRSCSTRTSPGSAASGGRRVCSAVSRKR